MQIYPAIDLYEGQVVRLKRGDYGAKTVYADHPEEMAQQWQDQGAQWIHVVDLEGAKNGVLTNLPSLKRIKKAVSCKIQWGGGIRKLEDIETLLEQGVDRIVLGTKALDPDFFKKASNELGSKLAVGLDVRNGEVQTEGWLKSGNVTLEDILAKLNKSTVETIIFTDIQKDGTLEGPNFEKLKVVLQTARAKVILSGGVASLKDIQECSMIKNKNFDGVIIGRALYDHHFSLKQAIEIMRENAGGESS